MLRPMTPPSSPWQGRLSSAPLLVWPVLAVLAAWVALLAAPGCSAKIGDSCEFNVDCSPQGERLCDLSSPGGYCTIENCTAEVCPEESHCIAFYPIAFLSRPCDPATEDALESPTDDCTPDEVCLSTGFCAPRASARRYCMLKCEDSSDCRDGYECRRTGLSGAEYVPPLSSSDATATVTFCAPKT